MSLDRVAPIFVACRMDAEDVIGRAGLNALLPLDDNIQHATIVHADEESLNMMSVLFENSAYYDEQSCCFVLRKMEIVCLQLATCWRVKGKPSASFLSSLLPTST